MSEGEMIFVVLEFHTSLRGWLPLPGNEEKLAELLGMAGVVELGRTGDLAERERWMDGGNEAAITYFGQPARVVCDRRCDKAWGINTRPRLQFSEDADDHAFLADGELGTAPLDPGTYEGCDGKPESPDAFPNKWCVRECERCTMSLSGEPLELPDFNERIYNQPWKHGEGGSDDGL
jgi:hypothetical protein